MIRLNVGAGPNLFPDWINLDRVDMTSYIANLRDTDNFEGWPQHQVDLAGHVKAGRVTCEVHDMRLGFPNVEAETVSAIYLGQVVEHLQPILEFPRLLLECFRILKRGAPIRITTPDFDLLLDAYLSGTMAKFAHEQPAFYLDAPPSAQFSYLAFGACGPDCTTEHYEGHFMLYSRQHMTAMLEGAGFQGVSYERRSDVFTECVDAGMSHSMAVEAVRP